MVEEYINPNLEVPEEELVEQLSSDEEERLEPLDTRATSVSEADWADQQIDASFDEDDEPEE
ncbi:MAG: hypothetical protein L0K44_02230 [Yaniella sp.]|nr:hypothetical protein [Yaniella sp.]